ncbi:hypothetical protein J8273_0894 [Carpediemonas membranifera]|uniref:Uncharacterized protein n=1 Tax=Carpediemonas membranifera TaxID=201153 RepID=A0A8J6E2B4_9EUKA|nr:hypothetical protein J8273_0894 [Carpediemonas membranifera]|eukprot:KAG9397404.1 hypothetical protein J8273_0894 [Carpediemonas membranifera]
MSTDSNEEPSEVLECPLRFPVFSAYAGHQSLSSQFKAAVITKNGAGVDVTSLTRAESPSKQHIMARLSSRVLRLLLLRSPDESLVTVLFCNSTTAAAALMANLPTLAYRSLQQHDLEAIRGADSLAMSDPSYDIPAALSAEMRRGTCFCDWNGVKTRGAAPGYSISDAWSGYNDQGEPVLLACSMDRVLHRMRKGPDIQQMAPVNFQVGIRTVAYCPRGNIIAAGMTRQAVEFYHGHDILNSDAKTDPTLMGGFNVEDLPTAVRLTQAASETICISQYGGKMIQMHRLRHNSYRPGHDRLVCDPIGTVRDSRAFSALDVDRHVLATGVGCAGAYVRLWDISQQRPFFQAGNFLGVLSMSVNVAAQDMVVGTGDGSWGYAGNVFTLDLRSPNDQVNLTGNSSARLSGTYFVRACLDGYTVISGHGNGHINFYDRRMGGVVHSISLRQKPRSKCIVTHIAEFGDEVVVTTASKNTNVVILSKDHRGGVM